MTEKQRLLRAVNRLATQDSSDRSRAVDEMRDIAPRMGAYAAAVAGTLVMLAVAEHDEHCYQDQLDSLHELSKHAEIPLSVVEPLRTSRKGFSWEDEYIEDILMHAELHAAAATQKARDPDSTT